MPGRWSTYARASGSDLELFFNEHFGETSRNLCFIMGRGFDPRMVTGIRRLRRACPNLPIQIILLTFDEGDLSPSRKYDEVVQANMKVLMETVDEKNVTVKALSMFSPERRRITARSAEALFKNAIEFANFSDIIVDVSALPRSVFMPVTAKLLHLIDGSSSQTPNLFVLADENVGLDSAFLEEGLDEEADYVHPFRGDAERESTAAKPRVWFPLLGENQGNQLRKISDLVKPSEVCPLLPAPSRNPRRGDDLVIEHREFLFDTLRVDPRNFLYVSEDNPFEVYRQLMLAISHYGTTLEPLGGANAILTAASSKLLSIGALLAAYELKKSKSRIAIAHIEAHGYGIGVELGQLSQLAEHGVTHCLWLAGECYEE
jgi:hypothetical protein